MANLSARFDGKVVLVTGAGGAIGSATADRFASEGARVVMVDLNPETVEAQAQRLRDLGGDVTALAEDLTTDTGAEDAVTRTEEIYGPLDVAALIAGMAAPRSFIHEMPIADWDRVISTNLRSMFLTLRASLANMVRNGTQGSVVTTSSSHALWDVHDGGAAYSSSKGAILSLTRVAAFDMGRHGIRVNTVAPGVIETPLGIPQKIPGMVMLTAEQRAARIPLGRIGQPRDVAAVIAFLASSDAAHITGAAHLIDGGQTLQSWANSPLEG
jgi:NAD(P)-dependent dehydrogenase (short-subunit alcohol dehydrogenase family)